MNWNFSKLSVSAAAVALLLAACGGGDGASPGPSAQTPSAAAEPGAPAAVGNIALDGLNWINYRRSQLGVSTLARHVAIDRAAQGHSDYQRINNIVDHHQVAGKPGFTGITLLDRLSAAGYVFANATYAYGEVISASASSSGFYLAEELVTAIYHRFVMFEPRFKEIGTGASINASGYAYFTSDFTANNGYGPGIGNATVVKWPFAGQTGVATNFFSDYESPDPVPNANEVGYPISVHGDINAAVTVQTFTIAPRGGSAVSVRMLSHATDSGTPQAAAAIIPLSPLRGGVTYDVRFVGRVDSTPLDISWTFTTK